MTEKQILKELKGFLTLYHCVRIEVAIGIEGFVQYCLVVAEIVQDYNSTQEDEDRVCLLLEKLAKKKLNKRKA